MRKIYLFQIFFLVDLMPMIILLTNYAEVPTLMSFFFMDL